jgi:hypothetical protein
MITVIVLYDLPREIGRDECEAHFLKIAPGFLAQPGFVRKQFIYSVEGGVAGGSYIWRSLAEAQAFFDGPWREGIRARYRNEPRVMYFETLALADAATGYAGAPLLAEPVE